jgi:hypothetical protein
MIEGKIHHLADFFCIGSTKRSTPTGKVLAKDGDLLTIYGSNSRDNTVTKKLRLIDPEGLALMDYELIELHEAAWV